MARDIRTGLLCVRIDHFRSKLTVESSLVTTDLLLTLPVCFLHAV